MANKIIITGRLTKNPELKTLQSGTEICNFTVAVNRRFKKDDQPNADFFNCISFGQKATFVNTWFQKGKMIYVEGSLQNRNWDDNEGKKHYVTEIIVDNVEFLGDKSSNETNTSNVSIEIEEDPDLLPF